MKKILFTALTLGCVVGVMAQGQEVMAPAKTGEVQQENRTSENLAKMMTERIHGIVNLTPEQYAKVLEINKASVEERKIMSANKEVIKSGQNAGNDAAGLTVKTANNSMEKIMELLTPEQKKKLEEAKSAAPQEQQMRLAQPMKRSSAVDANPGK